MRSSRICCSLLHEHNHTVLVTIVTSHRPTCIICRMLPRLTLGWIRPRRPPPPQLQFRRSRDRAHASIPLAQTPWGLTGRAWLQAGAQQAVIAVVPSFKSLGIDSRNVGVKSAGGSISKQMSLPPFIFLEAIRHIRHFLIDKVFKETLWSLSNHTHGTHKCARFWW